MKKLNSQPSNIFVKIIKPNFQIMLNRKVHVKIFSEDFSFLVSKPPSSIIETTLPTLLRTVRRNCPASKKIDKYAGRPALTCPAYKY